MNHDGGLAVDRARDREESIGTGRMDMKRPQIWLAVLAAVVVWAGASAYPVRAERAAGGTFPAEGQDPNGLGDGLKRGEELPTGKLTPKQQREVNRLVAHFRRAGSDLDDQVRVIRQAMSFGPPAVRALLESIGRQMQPALTRYRNRFQERAAALSVKRIRSANPEEIARLRQTVLDLPKGNNFTKEAIVRQADPAVKRLSEIFVVNRLEVLAGSKELQSDRGRLLGPGMLWERCAVYLYYASPDDADKPQEPPRFEQYLAGEEELAVGLAAPMDPNTRQILAANARLAGQLDPEEARAILALNLTRNLVGLPPLAIDPRLCAAARDHSNDMETLKFFAHNSPVSGKATPWDRAKRFGSSASAENIYVGSQDGKAATLGWFHSPPHHKNMMGNHKRVGVGRSGRYFTEMFGT
jgi:uncharacterized protein YkwD